MPDTLDALFAFVFAGATVWTLVPATESLARRIGAMDVPNERSLHEVPTPKLGGIAVLVAVLIGGSIFLPWDQETRSILAGAIVITAVGVIDDIVDLGAGRQARWARRSPPSSPSPPASWSRTSRSRSWGGSIPARCRSSTRR